MSQPTHAIINVEPEGAPREGMIQSGNPDTHPSGLTQPQLSNDHSNFSDGSGPLFNMYIKMSEEKDNKSAHCWQKDADGILIFTGLFSASVSVLVALSIQDLRPNPQDTSAFYLKNINQLLADPNVHRVAILSTPAEPPPFSPPKYAIWVNSLWLLSLVMSLTCGLLATLLQQWARRYVLVTRAPGHSPHKRARIRAFFADGVEKYHLRFAVEMLPTLLHLSLFLFLLGLLIFLYNINHTTFTAVVWWIGLSGGTYLSITLMPIFCQNSPYYGPLTFSAFFLYKAMIYGLSTVYYFIRSYFCCFSFPSTWHVDPFQVPWHTGAFSWNEHPFPRDEDPLRVRNPHPPPIDYTSAKIDDRILISTFQSLDEDRDLEQFFEGIPGFCGSNMVEQPRQLLVGLDHGCLHKAFVGFFRRTYASSLLSESVKERRVMLCMRAIDALDYPFPSLDILKEVFVDRSLDGALRCVQFGHSLRSRCESSDGQTALCAQGLIAGIIASLRPGHDHRWKALVKDQFSLSEAVFRGYIRHGDSMSLVNLIHFIRRLVRIHREHPDISSVAVKIQDFVLPLISKFDILRDTLPGLRHDFCVLWNELTREPRFDFDNILGHIRHLYIALDQDTNAAPINFDRHSPSSNPLCNIPGHHHSTQPTTTSPSTHPRASIHLLEQPRGSPNTPLISPIANSEPESQPAAATPASTYELSRTLRFGGTVYRQYNTDLDVVSPPSVPGNQSSPSPAPVPYDVLPTDPLMPSASPVSQNAYTTPGPGSLMLRSSPATSFTALSESNVVVSQLNGLNLAPNDVPSSSRDGSQTQELSRRS